MANVELINLIRNQIKKTGNHTEIDVRQTAERLLLDAAKIYSSQTTVNNTVDTDILESMLLHIVQLIKNFATNEEPSGLDPKCHPLVSELAGNKDNYVLYELRKFKIYDVKSPETSQTNFKTLVDENNGLIIWNKKRFRVDKKNDFVFFVNATGKKAYFTQLIDDNINSEIAKDGTEIVQHSNSTFKVIGQQDGKTFKSFVAFKILASGVITETSWAWSKAMRSAEVYFLWNKKAMAKSAAERISKLTDLRGIEWECSEMYDVIDMIEALTNTMPEANRN